MFHRRRMVAPINSVKHYVQRENAPITAATRVALIVANAVIAPANSATEEVREGSIIKAIFLELWLKGQGASDSDAKFQMALEKAPGDQAGVTFTDMNNMQAYDNKKNVLFFSQGVIGGIGGGQSIPVVRQWFKIPKGKQRMGLGDALVASVSATSEIIQLCGFSTYKEYV